MVKMVEYFQKMYKNSSNDFYEFTKQNLKDSKKMFVVTANPETLMIAEENLNLKKALLDNKTTLIADGIGVVKGAKILNYNINETIPGIELCTKLFEYCNEYNKSIFLFGAKDNVIKKLVVTINVKYPNLNICRI